jgi:hypothetical protein
MNSPSSTLLTAKQFSLDARGHIEIYALGARGQMAIHVGGDGNANHSSFVVDAQKIRAESSIPRPQCVGERILDNVVYRNGGDK